MVKGRGPFLQAPYFILHPHPKNITQHMRKPVLTDVEPLEDNGFADYPNTAHEWAPTEAEGAEDEESVRAEVSQQKAP